MTNLMIYRDKSSDRKLRSFPDPKVDLFTPTPRHARVLYERLKKNPEYWDKDLVIWKTHGGERQFLGNQLVGVLDEFKVGDPSLAIKRWDLIKYRYLDYEGFWRIDKRIQSKSNSFFTGDMFLGLLVMMELDRTNNQERYKAPERYKDKKHVYLMFWRDDHSWLKRKREPTRLWYERVGDIHFKRGAPVGEGFNLTDQLLGGLVEYFLGDHSLAKSWYADLKQRFWDDEKMVWYPIDERGEVDRTRPPVIEDQLWGVLTEIYLGDRYLASEIYLFLKREWWDDKARMWKSSEGYWTRDQLVGILVEGVVIDGLELGLGGIGSCR